MNSGDRTIAILSSDLDLLPDDWNYAQLSSLIDADRGISYGVVQPGSFDRFGVPIVRVNNVRHGVIVADDVLRVNPDIEQKYSRTRLRGGEVLLTLVGTIGECAVVPNNMAGWNVARAIAVIPVLPEIGAKWVALCLRTPLLQHYINTWAVITVQATLNLKEVTKLPIPLPPKHERDAIETILCAFDDKIDLLQKTNKTLEEIGNAIFKHWFIDFEFPNEEGKPYKSCGGEMVYNEELRKEIPKGWKVGKLGEYTEVLKGCSYKSDDLKESDIALVTLKSIDRGGGFNQNGYKEYVGEFSEDQVVKDGEIVVAQTDLTQKAEVIGTPAIVNSLGRYSKIVASLDLQIVRSKNDISKNYVYHLLRTEDFHNHALSYTNGTTVLHLNKNAVPEFISIIPPREISVEFDKIDDSLSTKRTLSEAQTQTLSHLRDSLLPKLMSGKVRVRVEAR